MKKVLSIFCLLALVLVSCATKYNLDAQYPETDYVRATGYGSTMEEAELNAKTELASLFGLSISTETTRSLVDTYTKDSLGNEAASYSEYFTDASRISVDIDNLYGVKVVEREQGKTECYVTVVMERKMTAEYYLSQIEQNLKVIENLENAINAALGTFSAIDESLNLIKMIEECNTKTVMYNYLSNDSHSYCSLASAYALLNRAKSDIILIVDVSGDDSGSVKSSISRIFTENGIAISKGDDIPTAKIVVSIIWHESQGTGVASSFVFEEYNADVSVMDVAGGEILFVISFNGKEGHQNYDGAKTRAIKDIVKQIETELEPAINERFSL